MKLSGLLGLWLLLGSCNAALQDGPAQPDTHAARGEAVTPVHPVRSDVHAAQPPR